jgi:hypothetical protein
MTWPEAFFLATLYLGGVAYIFALGELGGCA